MNIKISPKSEAQPSESCHLSLAEKSCLLLNQPMLKFGVQMVQVTISAAGRKSRISARDQNLTVLADVLTQGVSHLPPYFLPAIVLKPHVIQLNNTRIGEPPKKTSPSMGEFHEPRRRKLSRPSCEITVWERFWIFLCCQMSPNSKIRIYHSCFPKIYFVFF